MELHVRRDEGGGEFCVGSRSCTTATDVVRDVVDLKTAYMRLNTRLRTPNDSPYLLTVLVGDDGTGCGSSIGGNLLMRVSMLSSWLDGDSSVWAS